MSRITNWNCRRIVVALLSAIAGGSLSAPAATAQSTTTVENGVKITRDIAYREGNQAWKLDLYQPVKRGDEARPGLVFIHSGGWMYGDKRGADGMLTEYARKGFVGISVNYRLTGEAPFPACVQDMRCAVRWFRAQAGELNVNVNRIGGFGHSAGAHLVAFLGVAGPDAKLDDGPHQEQSSLLNAVCCVATPTDFAHWHRPIHQQQSLVQLLVKAGPEEQLAERVTKASPITYVSAQAPPYLIIHGTEDKTVGLVQAQRFAQALWDAGVENVSLHIISRTAHSPHSTHPLLVNPLVEAFFDTTIGPQREAAAAALRGFERQQQQRRSGGSATFSQILEDNDRDHDGKVKRAEFNGPPPMFGRLDRNGDGVLTADDFPPQRQQPQ